MKNITIKKAYAGEYFVHTDSATWVVRRFLLNSWEWELGQMEDGQFVWHQTFDSKKDCIAYIRSLD